MDSHNVSFQPRPDGVVVGSDVPPGFLQKLGMFLRRLWHAVLTNWRYRAIAIIVVVVVAGVIVMLGLMFFRPSSEPIAIAPEASQEGDMIDTNNDGQPDTPAPQGEDDKKTDDDTDSSTNPPSASQNGTGATGGSSGGGDTGNGGGSNNGGNSGGSSGGNSGGGGGGSNPGTGDCALPKYPTPNCTGVPVGWSPSTTINGDLNVTQAGAVIENHLVTGSISVQAPNVTIRNTRVYGEINNSLGNTVFGPMLIEDSEVVPPPGQSGGTVDFSAIGESNYTCRRCKIVNRIEGWRISSAVTGSGPVTIEHSYAKIGSDPAYCAQFDPHGDGIQGFFGTFATIHHNTIDQRNDPCTTAPLFIADSSAGGNITDNVLAGGTFTMRLLDGNFPTVTGNKIVNDEWAFGPFDTTSCNQIGTWSGNALVTFNFTTGTIINHVGDLNDCA